MTQHDRNGRDAKIRIPSRGGCLGWVMRQTDRLVFRRTPAVGKTLDFGDDPHVGPVMS